MGEVAVAIGSLVVEFGILILDAVKYIFEADKKRRKAQSNFTETLLTQARQQHPGKNALALYVWAPFSVLGYAEFCMEVLPDDKEAPKQEHEHVQLDCFGLDDLLMVISI